MRVQTIAMPPIEAAKAMMTVKVVFVVEVAPLVGGTVPVELASEEVMVWNSVFCPWDGVLVGDGKGASFCGGGVEGGGVGVDEEEVDEDEDDDDDEELEEDTPRLELELWEREGVREISEVGESGSDGLELGNRRLETDETELAGRTPWLGSSPSPFVPMSMTSPWVCLPRSAGVRLRSILWPSSWVFADAPSVKTSIKAREQKSVRTSFLDLTLSILAKGIF
jgi:hypothetical protein